MTRLIALSLSLREEHEPLPTASLTLQLFVLPVPDSPLAHFLQTPDASPVSSLQSAWRDDTLAVAAWNVPLNPARRQALQSLLPRLRDLLLPSVIPASQPAPPADALPPEPDLFTRGSVAFLDSFTGAGGACIFPADTPGRVGVLLSNRFANPSLESADRFIELWLPLLRRVALNLAPEASLTFQPRSGELLGRVISTLCIDPPEGSEAPLRSSIGNVFVAGPHFCLAWNLAPEPLRVAIERLGESPPSSSDPYPLACLRFAASLHALAVARYPDQAARILPLARSLNLIGPPGLLGAMECAPAGISLFVSLDLNDLALALTALAPPEPPPSP